MNLAISRVADKGLFDKERLVIKVTQDTDVGTFVIFRTGVTNDAVNINVSETYWFPDKRVKAGDLVVLYTKSGTNSEKILDTGNKTHFFYWGKSQALWSTPQKAAVLLHAPVWEATGTAEL